MSQSFHKAGIAALLGAVASIIIFAPTGASADDSTSHSVRVKIGDLNRNSVEGAKRIYERLLAAAFAACGESEMDIEVMIRGPGECEQRAVGYAVHDVHSLELSRLYTQKNGINLAKEYGVTTDVLTASQ